MLCKFDEGLAISKEPERSFLIFLLKKMSFWFLVYSFLLFPQFGAVLQVGCLV